MPNVDEIGSGEVLKAGQHVCHVRYALRQTDNVKGWSHITGTIRVDDAEKAARPVLKVLGSGDMLDLRLEDGRVLHAWFSASDAAGEFWTVRLAAGTAPLK